MSFVRPVFHVFRQAPLLTAARAPASRSFASALFTFKGDGYVKIRDLSERRFTALHYAALSDDYGQVMALLQDGYDPNVREPALNATALHLAVAMDKRIAVGSLLAFGADPNLKDKLGMTPLHLAADGGYPFVILDLLEAGADPTLVNDNGQMALALIKQGEAEFSERNGFNMALRDLEKATYAGKVK